MKGELIYFATSETDRYESPPLISPNDDEMYMLLVVVGRLARCHTEAGVIHTGTTAGIVLNCLCMLAQQLWDEEGWRQVAAAHLRAADALETLLHDAVGCGWLATQ